MIPDIIGYNINDGLYMLKQNGFSLDDIVLHEYMSPKMDIIGNDLRILKAEQINSKIILTISYF
jgi:hypothetical protein